MLGESDSWYRWTDGMSFLAIKVIAFTGENEDHGKYEFQHLQNKNDSQSVDNDSTDKRK